MNYRFFLLNKYLIYCRFSHKKLESYRKMPFTCSDICKIILAIILPPLGVLAEKGCGVDLLINIALTILGFIPGIIHALYIIFKYWLSLFSFIKQFIRNKSLVSIKYYGLQNKKLKFFQFIFWLQIFINFNFSL